MCTGAGASSCIEERLAWEIYAEHGYRPRELRPCLTAPEKGAVRAERNRPRWPLRRRDGPPAR